MSLEKRPNRPIRTAIRAYRYKRKDGFLIYSQERFNRISIFVDDLELAVRIKNAYREKGWTNEQISKLLVEG